eukprot:11155671-Lingulodinium_polyedra.AAC.1
MAQRVVWMESRRTAPGVRRDARPVARSAAGPPVSGVAGWPVKRLRAGGREADARRVLARSVGGFADVPAGQP